MTIIIGSEPEGVSATAVNQKIGYVTKRTAAKTGKLKTLKLRIPVTNKSTEWRLGIFHAAAEKPGAFMAESATVTIASEKAVTLEAELSEEVELTEGTEYFIAALSLTAGGKVSKATEKTNWGFKSTAGILELKLGTFTNAEAKFGEPMGFFGEESGVEVKQIAGITKLKLATVDALRPVMGLTPVGAARFSAKDAPSQAQLLAPATKARFKDGLELLTGNQIAIVGKTEVRFKTLGAATASQGLAGTTKARFQQANAPNQAQGLTPTTKARLKASEEPLILSGLAGTTKARFKASDAQSSTVGLTGASKVRFQNGLEVVAPSSVTLIAGVSTLKLRAALMLSERVQSHRGLVSPRQLGGRDA